MKPRSAMVWCTQGMVLVFQGGRSELKGISNAENRMYAGSSETQ